MNTVRVGIQLKDYNGKTGDKLSKGISVWDQGINQPLSFDLSSNLLKINFYNCDFNWTSASRYTFIGKI